MKNLRLEIEGGRAQITLDRPPVNVLNIEMMGEMAEALGLAAATDDLRVLVLRAEGKAFSAGVDVGEHMGDLAPKMLGAFNELIANLLDFPLPTIALVGGMALGGGMELTLACDMVYATERAKFGQPEVKVGVYPPPAVVILPELIGPRRAADLIMTGRTIDAAEACSMGLVNAVWPAGEFEAKAEEVIAGLVGLSGSVLRHTVEVHRSGRSFREAMESVEEHYLEELMKSHDAVEGLTAFLEKRTPEWTHE